MAGFLGISIFWVWLGGAIVLLLLELALPGVFLVWFGLAALATAIISYILSPIFSIFGRWEMQIFIFIIFSIIAVIAAKRYFMRDKQSDSPFLNHTLEELIGQTALLTEPMHNNQGTVSINDTLWRIEGENLPKGAKIRLTAYKNGIFSVKRAD